MNRKPVVSRKNGKIQKRRHYQRKPRKVKEQRLGYNLGKVGRLFWQDRVYIFRTSGVA